MFIYKITNNINGKVYIGQSVNYVKRFKAHRGSARRGDGYPVHQAISKYGINNFTFEVIDGANSKSELNYKEIHYIHKFNSLSPNGYNLKLGEVKHIESRKKQSESLKRTISKEKLDEMRNISLEKTRKKVLAYNPLTNEKLTFESLRECTKSFGTSVHRIGYMLNGKYPYKKIKGFYFEYLDGTTVKKTPIYKSAQDAFNKQIGG